MSLRLGNLVLVMRKDEVESATVDVECRPMQPIDIAALDVPAGPPAPHGLSQLGSPGVTDFHSAKSAGCRLPATVSGLCSASTFCPESFP